MKRIMAALLTTVVAVTTLAGCSNTKKNDNAAYLKDIELANYVTLGDYKGVTVEVESPEVSDTEVESYLQYVQSSMAASVEVTDRAVQEGDTVNIDYAGKYADSGEAFDGGTAQGYDLVIGSHTFIDGFEDGLVGAAIGETRDLNLTFPENYGKEDLAGKPVIFTVTVNSIKVKPAFDDSYAVSLGIEGVSTLDDLRNYIKTKLLEDKQTTYNNNVQNEVLEAVTNGCMFENPPQALIDRMSKNYAAQMDKVASYYSANYGQSMTTDSVLQSLMAQEGYTGELEDYKNEKALELAKQYIMLGAIADKESITVSDDELDEKLTSDMDAANATASDDAKVNSLDDYKKTVDTEDVKETLLTRKVLEFLAQNANVVAPADNSGSDSSDAATEETTENTDEAADAATEESSEEATTEETSTEASSEDNAD